MAAVKYFYENVYEGPDRALIGLHAGAPEREFPVNTDGRYFSAQQACWRIL